MMYLHFAITNLFFKTQIYFHNVQVLLYLMGNVKNVVQAWRKRQYFYASASVFNCVAKELIDWVTPECQDEDGEVKVDEVEKKKRVKAMFKIQDYGDMYRLIIIVDLELHYIHLYLNAYMHRLVSDAIVSFVDRKTSPFPGASLSKKNFLSIPAWKRAIIYINMTRHSTEIHANNHWHKFGYEHYKANKKMFELYCKLDDTILKRGRKFRQMPDEQIMVSTPNKVCKKRKRTHESFELSSPEMVTRTRKIVCLITSSDDSDGSDSSEE